jgi:molecular chaperone IbpA
MMTLRITFDLAGFRDEVTRQQNTLTVAGRKTEKGDHSYFYKGISGVPFERRFDLADHVEVRDASFANGLLQIDLVRELPEAVKPRRIEIKSGAARPAGKQSEQIATAAAA